MQNRKKYDAFNLSAAFTGRVCELLQVSMTEMILLFDNSSVKLCKHDTPLLFAPSGANHEQGLGWDRVCEAQRSNESPSGAFKRQRGLR